MNVMQGNAGIGLSLTLHCYMCRHMAEVTQHKALHHFVNLAFAHNIFREKKEDIK